MPSPNIGVAVPASQPDIRSIEILGVQLDIERNGRIYWTSDVIRVRSLPGVHMHGSDYYVSPNRKS